MKRLFVWLASVSICAAQAVSIGPFATEDWVDERLQVLTNDFATIPYVDDAVGEVEDKIPDVSIYATKSYVNAVSNAIPDVSGFATVDYVDAVSNAIPDVSGFATKAYVDAVSNAIPDTSMFSTVEYVNTTSNNLTLLMDDLVSDEELGSSVSNIVPAWALVPIPPVTAEVDPAFTNWLATTNVVIDDNFGTFVSNVVPSWALVPIPPVTVEVDPAFTNWLATTNSATAQYVDEHKWDWSTQITNHPSFATVADATLQMYRVYTEWAFTQEFEDAVEAIAGFDCILVIGDTSWMLYANNEDGSIHEAVGSFGYNDDGNPTAIYFYEPTEKYSDLYDEFNWKEVASRQAITGYCLGSQTNKLLQTAGDYADKEYVNRHQWTWASITNPPAFPTYSDTTLTMGSNEYDLAGFASTTWVESELASKMNTTDCIADGDVAVIMSDGNAYDSGSHISSFSRTDHVHYSITTDEPGVLGGVGATLEINNDGIATVTWHPGTLPPAPDEPVPQSWTKVIAYTNDLVGYFTENSQSITVGRRDPISAVGHRSVCIGYDTNTTVAATGMFGVAVGQSLSAHGDYSLVRGRNEGTYSDYSTLIGHENSCENSELSLIVGESLSSYDSPRSVNLGMRNGMQGATNSFMYGYESTMYGSYSTGFGRHLSVTNNEAFAFGWGMSGATTHGDGTFNINPTGGLAGFWIGETNLATHLDSSSKIALDAIAPAFSASNVYTNGDYVIYDLHLYECTNYTGTAGWRAGDWQQTTVTGILGNLRRILDAINGEAL